MLGMELLCPGDKRISGALWSDELEASEGTCLKKKKQGELLPRNNTQGCPLYVGTHVPNKHTHAGKSTYTYAHTGISLPLPCHAGILCAAGDKPHFFELWT